MIERYSATVLSFAQIGSFGFLTKAIDSAPFVSSGALSRAMPMIVGSIEIDAMYTRGFQPRLCAALIALRKNFGVAKSISVPAFDALRVTPCEETSASVNSYACFATIRGPLPAI